MLWHYLPEYMGFRQTRPLSPELEAAYNTAVQGQDTLEGLNVSVTERTVSSADESGGGKDDGVKGIRHSDRYIKGGYSSEVRRDGL